MTLDDLENMTGIKFKSRDLLTQAFIHRSFLNEDRTSKQSNERLEFLGDAVLSFLTSHYLYTKFAEFPEGTLTNIRSGLVKTKTLSRIADTLGLGNLLFLSRGEEESGGRKNPSLLADAFEAYLGAMFLDRGIEICRDFLTGYLFPVAQEIVDKKAYIDFKSHLQEIIQEISKNSPVYRVIRSEGPDHNKIFWVEVLSGEKALGSGSGKSKQEAEQSAASDALEKIGQS
ncbi:ribonuclease III [Candidatus Gottesmanbacteria bacterium RBG_16_52_11]|uniref:Ribonuclease 3 n=1 Tax=Candidatus Gottesmanbacteria bacterium RBG_16_52_11 TaxID=1798374 RepID=A0A1F5YPL3_9BACT|nr:MAG: ribonuclease III [Candidatus Gottesmanbacteria bacterium RBG_16_52_11]